MTKVSEMAAPIEPSTMVATIEIRKTTKMTPKTCQPLP